MMKRILGIVIAASLLGAGAASAGEIGFGAGAFGGYCAAFVQDDTGNGFIYGARVPVRLIHLVTAEPFYQTSNLADVTTDIGGAPTTIPGVDLSAFGVNLIIGSVGGSGMTFYPYAGVGSYELQQTGGTSSTNTGWSFGLGLGLPPMSKFSIQLRAEADMIVTGNTSRKFGSLTAGLNYSFGH